jgi:hypothetical protein
MNMASVAVEKLIEEAEGNKALLLLFGELAGEIRQHAGDPAGSNNLADELDTARKAAAAPPPPPEDELEENGDEAQDADDDTAATKSAPKKAAAKASKPKSKW